MGISADSRVWWVRKTQATFPDKISIGRSRNNDITIQEANVSKLHCYLSAAGEDFTITDAESRNGTTVGSHDLTMMEPHPLKDQDEIALGGTSNVMFCSPSALLNMLALVKPAE